MKRALTLVLAVLVILLFSSCGAKKDVLYVYNWSYYTPDEVIEAFEEEFNCEVIMDYFASNEEMFAKLMVTGESSGYDIVFPSSDYVTIMKKLDMVEELDHEKLPNLKYITPLAREKSTSDPEMKHSVPYFLGAAGIAVNKTKLQDYERDWSLFERTDLKGRMCMLDDLREVIGAALQVLGYSCNSTDPDELEEAYNYIDKNWKPNLAKFDAEGFAKSFASGEYVVAHGYAESFYEEIPESMWDDIDFFIPEECSLYIDSMVIPKGARHKDLAHEFINFMIEPHNYALFLDYFGFPSTTNTEAAQYMTTEPYYTEDMIIQGEVKDDLGEALELYNSVWERIRYGN